MGAPGPPNPAGELPSPADVLESNVTEKIKTEGAAADASKGSGGSYLVSFVDLST
jgi:hypothetical protein